MKAIHGRRYKLTTDFAAISKDTETIASKFEKGESFRFDETIMPERGGCFVADFDGVLLSLEVINKFNESAKKILMKEVA